MPHIYPKTALSHSTISIPSNTPIIRPTPLSTGHPNGIQIQSAVLTQRRYLAPFLRYCSVSDCLRRLKNKLIVAALIAATARIAAEHRSFNRIRQMAPICTIANVWFLAPTRARLSPKWHLHWFIRFARLTVVTSTHRRQTHRHTDIHVAIARIYAITACDAG